MGPFLPAPSLLAQSHGGKYNINKIKAAYVYNFFEFVTWPDVGKSTSGDSVVIGILGQTTMSGAFSPVEGTRLLGKKLVVRSSDRLEDLMDSRILFVSSSEAARMGRVLKALGNQPILTVSDMDDFAQSGGMIQLYAVEIQGEVKVRFDINKDSVDDAGLRISFRLLSLARPKP